MGEPWSCWPAALLPGVERQVLPCAPAVCGDTSTWMGWSPCPDVGEGEALASGPWAARAPWAGRAPRAPCSVRLSAHGWPCQAALLRLRSRKSADSGRLPGSRGRAGARFLSGGAVAGTAVTPGVCPGHGVASLWVLAPEPCGQSRSRATQVLLVPHRRLLLLGQVAAVGVAVQGLGHGAGLLTLALSLPLCGWGVPASRKGSVQQCPGSALPGASLLCGSGQAPCPLCLGFYS